MYWLAALVLAVPPGVVTVTVAGPWPPAGAVTVSSVSENHRDVFEAAIPPKVTDVAPVKPLPVIVTAVPPLVGPVLGKSSR